jgi:hypothetical protein
VYCPSVSVRTTLEAAACREHPYIALIPLRKEIAECFLLLLSSCLMGLKIMCLFCITNTFHSYLFSDLYQRRNCLTLWLLINNECGSTFLSIAPQYRKEHFFVKGFQVSTVFYTGKSSHKMNTCKEHWCKDTKRGKLTIYEQKAADNNAKRKSAWGFLLSVFWNQP